MKSAINGSGYGDKHTWIRGETFVADYAQNKGTIYICECGANFVHRYDIDSDIFKAMKNNNVREECLLSKNK